MKRGVDLEDLLQRRLKSFLIFLISCFLILSGRLFQLQILQGEEYEVLSWRNRTQVLPIAAPRGKIIASDGRILVSNRFAFSTSIIPEQIRREDLFRVARSLASILSLDEEIIIRKVTEAGRSSIPIPVKRNISQKELVMIEENRRQLPGVIIEKEPLRDYVYGDLASHLLGYLGEVSRRELEILFSQGYRAGAIIGRDGLERYYEDFLRGIDGQRQIEVNSYGQEIRALGNQSPQPGYDLVLHLDYDLQVEAEKILRTHLERLEEEAYNDPEIVGPPTGGSIILMDPYSGAIYAMASSPYYDPNLFATGITAHRWDEIVKDQRNPLISRSIGKTPPPGSVFKLVTAAAAIEELGVRSDTRFFDPGFFQLGGIRWYNWMDYGQGRISFLEAIAHSNNIVFYNLGHELHKLGQELLQNYAKEYGLGSLTGIDLPGEMPGVVPDDAYKRRTEKEMWYPGDSVNLSIGQGSLQTTPIQLTNIIAAIANGGALYRPRVVDEILTAEGEVFMENRASVLNTLSIPDRALEIIKRGLEDVISYGTASTLRSLPIKIAGKTGTAETGLGRPSHGWFIGYAPAQDPVIAFSVFLEHGSSSSRTLPLVYDLMVEYFQLH